MCVSDLQLQREAKGPLWMWKHIGWWTGCRVSSIVQPNPNPSSKGTGVLRFLPWVLIVQAESYFIDSMCMRHDHIEAILRGETEKETDSEQEVVRKEKKGIHSRIDSTGNSSSHLCQTVHHTGLCKVKCSCRCLIPGNSWLLSSTWCTHGHHLFG